MEKIALGGRCLLFRFQELAGLDTYVLAIHGESGIFIIDTFLGPQSMAQVLGPVRAEFGCKPFIIINSHFHWDHIWGNCLFAKSWIIGHSKCREFTLSRGPDELSEYKDLIQGDVILTPPNVVFETTMAFPEDEIELFYSPGHTEDSISVWDSRDKILFAGDNLERPIPYISKGMIHAHCQTLRRYLEFPASRIIAGHCLADNKSIISDNLKYLESLESGHCDSYLSEPHRSIHLANLKTLET
jgi:cyclase